MRNLEFLLLKNKVKLDKIIREKSNYKKIVNQNQILDKYTIDKINTFIKYNSGDIINKRIHF